MCSTSDWLQTLSSLGAPANRQPTHRLEAKLVCNTASLIRDAR
jgi:hypothetical protein